MTAEQVVIPDIGDAKDVEVIEICVSVGERVAVNDALIVIESDKASMEVPAPFRRDCCGHFLGILGDVVNTGDSIATIDVDSTAVSTRWKRSEETRSDSTPDKAEVR